MRIDYSGRRDVERYEKLARKNFAIAYHLRTTGRARSTWIRYEDEGKYWEHKAREAAGQ
jgi:hypothetical protein